MLQKKKATHGLFHPGCGWLSGWAPVPLDPAVGPGDSGVLRPTGMESPGLGIQVEAAPPAWWLALPMPGPAAGSWLDVDFWGTLAGSAVALAGLRAVALPWQGPAAACPSPSMGGGEAGAGTQVAGLEWRRQQSSQVAPGWGLLPPIQKLGCRRGSAGRNRPNQGGGALGRLQAGLTGSWVWPSGIRASGLHFPGPPVVPHRPGSQPWGLASSCCLPPHARPAAHASADFGRSGLRATPFSLSTEGAG